MAIMEALVALISAIIGIIVFFAAIPFTGVVVRLRVNFTPRGVGLGDAESLEGQQRLTNDPRVGPVVTSLWAMFLRVKRIEGIAGLYKGFMPVLLTGMWQSFLAQIVLTSGSGYSVVTGGFFTTIVWAVVIVLFVEIPRTVLMNRAITTPHKLGWFSPRVGLRVLFTPHERARPWSVFLTPGLAATQVLRTLYFLGIVRGVRALLAPRMLEFLVFSSSPSGLQIVGIIAYLFFLVLSTIVLCPLDVLAARLSVQRNHPSATLDADGAPMEAGLEYAGAEEDVIALRDEDQPYEGLYDAVKKVVDEEGWPTLYRAWYLTLIGGVLAGLA